MTNTIKRLTALRVVVFGLACSLLTAGAFAQDKTDSTAHKIARKTDNTAHKVAVKTDTLSHKVARTTAGAAKTVGHETAKTAKTVSHKTASTAVKGASAVTDKVYKDKQGPHGENVYIDKQDRKYCVDSKGKKVYLKSSQIRDKKAA